MKPFTKAAIVLAFLFLQQYSKAQFTQIAQGPNFEEPTEGFSRLLAMKNGSVVFLNVIPEEGIRLRLYDASHKETVNNSFKPAYGKLKGGELEDVFEINGDIIILVSAIDKKVPVLYRLILDGKTGNLKKEEKIAELKKMDLGMGYAHVFGSVPLPELYIEKDPESDNYAVVLFNSFESDRNKRIEIVFYGSQHQELNRAYYNSPDDKYKYLEFVSMAVIGDESVSVLAIAYNKEKDKELILASLQKGASEVKFSEVGFPKDSQLEKGLIQYNPKTKNLVILGKLYDPESKSAQLYTSMIDPVNEKLITGKLQTYNDAIAEMFGKTYKFNGSPEVLSFNSDEGFTIVFEESSYTTSTFSNGHTITILNTYNILVSDYDKTGALKNSYWVPKFYYIGDGFSNLYKTFTYLKYSDKNCILINDYRRNIEMQENKKPPVQVKGVSDCDAFYFPLTGTDVFPKRKYLFGESEDKKERSLAALGISVYDKINNVFVVVKLNIAKGKKNASVIWLKPE